MDLTLAILFGMIFIVVILALSIMKLITILDEYNSNPQRTISPSYRIVQYHDTKYVTERKFLIFWEPIYRAETKQEAFDYILGDKKEYIASKERYKLQIAEEKEKRRAEKKMRKVIKIDKFTKTFYDL